MRLLAAIALATVLSGCSSLLPETRKDNASIKSTGQITERHDDSVTHRSALPAINISGKENKLDLSFPPGTKFESETKSVGAVDSQGSDSATGSSSTKLPLSVALVIGGVGLLVIAGAVFWIIRRVREGAAGAAAAVAFSAGDRAVAGTIEMLETTLRNTNDPAQKQTLLCALASAEKARGKLAATSPAKDV